MWRRKMLASLHQELETIALFDRVHDLTLEHDSADDRAYASRQIRRSQIAAEIKKLSRTRMKDSKILLVLAVALLIAALSGVAVAQDKATPQELRRGYCANGQSPVLRSNSPSPRQVNGSTVMGSRPERGKRSSHR